MSDNVLYYGDNLDILRRYIKDETVHLVYLDPPFKSNQDYNVLFAEQNGSRSAAQIRAFEDTWRWDQAAARASQEIIETGPENVSKAMQAFRMFLGESDMMAYLAMMAPRLVELRGVLKPTGSIYLQCSWIRCSSPKIVGTRSFGKERAHIAMPGDGAESATRCFSTARQSNTPGRPNMFPTMINISQNDIIIRTRRPGDYSGLTL
jgi:DNA modification methylase